MDFVRLKCVEEGRKLRIKIISPGYNSEANCQFPRDIRVANREYIVPREDVTFTDTRGKFFYRIKKTNIQVSLLTNVFFLKKLNLSRLLKLCQVLVWI